MRDAQKDMVTASEHNYIDIIESIILDGENNMEDDVDICEYNSNTLQK